MVFSFLDPLLRSAPGYESFRTRFRAQASTRCATLLTLLLVVCGFIIFIVQASLSSNDSVFVLENTAKLSEKLYKDALPLPDAHICPGNGYKANDKLQNITEVRCFFYKSTCSSSSSSSCQVTTNSIEVTGPEKLPLRSFDGTIHPQNCFVVASSKFHATTMYDHANCGVFFPYNAKADKNFFFEDLLDEQSRVFFTPPDREPLDSPLYWKRLEPLKVTVVDLDLAAIRLNKHETDSFMWYQADIIDRVSYEFVNFTEHPDWFKYNPASKVTFGYGEWFADGYKRVHIYPSGQMMGVVFGYAYLLFLLGVAILFLSAWGCGWENPFPHSSEHFYSDGLGGGGEDKAYLSQGFGQAVSASDSPTQKIKDMKGSYGAIE